LASTVYVHIVYNRIYVISLPKIPCTHSICGSGQPYERAVQVLRVGACVGRGGGDDPFNLETTRLAHTHTQTHTCTHTHIHTRTDTRAHAHPHAHTCTNHTLAVLMLACEHTAQFTLSNECVPRQGEKMTQSRSHLRMQHATSPPLSPKEAWAMAALPGRCTRLR
jgi:hypothetical protein